MASNKGKTSFKPRANGRNTVGQQLQTLLDVTCCVRLHTVACCWMLLGVVAQSLKPFKFFSQQLPTFLLFCDCRSVAQQCWIRLHGSSNIVGCNALYAWITKTCGLFSSHDALQVPNLLGVVASVCTPLPTRTQQLPTLLAQQCWELLRPFARSLILSSQPRDKVSILVDKTMQIFFAEFAQKKNEKFQVEGTAFLLFNQQAAATSTETSNSSCYASVQSKSRPSSPLGITSKGITRPKPLPAFTLEPRASPRRRENEHNIFVNGALGRDLTSLIHHRN